MSMDKNTLIHVNKLVQDHKLIKWGGKCNVFELHSDFKAGISGSFMCITEFMKESALRWVLKSSTFKVLLWLPPELGNWGQEVCT